MAEDWSSSRVSDARRVTHPRLKVCYALLSTVRDEMCHMLSISMAEILFSEVLGRDKLQLSIGTILCLSR